MEWCPLTNGWPDSDRIRSATPVRLPVVDALIASAARPREAVLVHRDTIGAPSPPRWWGSSISNGDRAGG